MIETLSKAIREFRSNQEGEGSADSKDLLGRAKIVLEFGRTDWELGYFRGRTEEAERILACIKHANVSFLDRTSVEALGVLESSERAAEALVDATHTLVVRPQGALSGACYVFRVEQPVGISEGPHATKNGKVEERAGKLRQHRVELKRATAREPDMACDDKVTESLKRLGGERLPTGRPVRASVLADRLIGSPGSFKPERGWTDYRPQRCFQTVEDITANAKFRESLRDLRDRLEDRWLKTLFIYGETGSGKEIVARWVHAVHPHRLDKTESGFIPVSAARLDGNLVDSEIFGHKIGSFSGAVEDRPGAIVSADGKILLIDDIDSLATSTQAKLLRVIENGVVEPVGHKHGDPTPVDTFVIMTTNVHPRKLLKKKKLRKDLYYRLIRGACLELPPLRDRIEDAVNFAMSLWAERNLWSLQEVPWPAALETAIRSSRLKGNFRVVSAVVDLTFFEARKKPSRELVSLPEMATKWLQMGDSFNAVSAEDPMTHALREDGLLVETRTGDLASRLDRFLVWWAEWASAFPQDRSLKRARIQSILGLRDKQQNSLQKALRTLADTQTLPRVERDGFGCASRWRVVAE